MGKDYTKFNKLSALDHNLIGNILSNINLSRAKRLDQYVAEALPLISRSSASKLITNGKVTINNEVHLKPGHKISIDDRIAIDYDSQSAINIPKIDIPIIYEDDSCVVINKPLGVLSHSKSDFSNEATVASWVMERTASMTGDRAGIVHRLDRATSGIMICAKNPQALSWLQKQFSTRKVKKTYIAIVSGVMNLPEAIIDMPIERNPKKPQTFKVGVNGKISTTYYKVIKNNLLYSLLELKPTTGRTHQLRVHLANLGHPILGDDFYGGQEAGRLFLHALSLEITLPNRNRIILQTDLPKEFNEVLNNDVK